MELVVAILVFVGILALTTLLFGGWLIVAVIRLISRMLMAPFRASTELESTRTLPGAASATTTTTIRCLNDRCRAENPAVASFCRRCGSPARTAVQPVQARRVAMW